jgi:two-component system sensor histidine kinase PilS (NtrC family)
MSDRDPDKASSERLGESESLARQLRWIIGIRLVVITSVLLPYFGLQYVAPDTPLGLDFLYVFAGVTYFASLIYIALLRLLPGRWPLQAIIQFCGDLVLITAMVYYFGGVASPFSILYFVVIIVASALFPRRTGFAVATSASLLYSATILALFLGWLPPPIFDNADSASHPTIQDIAEPGISPAVRATHEGGDWRLVYNLITHIFGFFTVAYLTTRLAAGVSRAEQELQEKQEDLADLQMVHRDVIESIPSGLITCNLEGLVTTANLAAQEILGKTGSQLIGRPVTSLGLFSEEQWLELASKAGSYPRARPEASYSRGGTVRYIGFSVTPLTNADELRTGYILIFQDLSDWRKLQEELRLKDRLAAVGELASGIAHEVGNPLAAISGSVQMLSRSQDGEPSENRLLDIILKESQRLDRTIKSFLQFARPKERSSVRFNIARLLDEHVELLRNSSEVSDHHRLDLSLDPNSVTVIADPDQISQIFWNLARNALRAMPDGGSLSIEGRLDAGRYRMRFVDTGCGMTEEERERMFHPFRSFFDGGSGIGMAIVYRIVQEHGGNLQVDSKPDQGTTIIVELPTAPEAPRAAPEEI